MLWYAAATRVVACPGSDGPLSPPESALRIPELWTPRYGQCRPGQTGTASVAALGLLSQRRTSASVVPRAGGAGSATTQETGCGVSEHGAAITTRHAGGEHFCTPSWGKACEWPCLTVSSTKPGSVLLQL